MGGNFLHDQTVVIENLRRRRIQCDGQIADVETFARSKALLILERSAFLHQQGYKTGRFRKQWRSVRPGDVVNNRAIAGQRPRIEKGGQILAMIDMQMREQYDVYVLQVQLQLAYPDERARPRIDEDPRRAIHKHQIA